MSFHVMPSNAMPHHDISHVISLMSCNMPYYVTSCLVMSGHIASHHDISHVISLMSCNMPYYVDIMSCHVRSHCITAYISHVISLMSGNMPYYVTSCLVMSGHIASQHTMIYHLMSCPIYCSHIACMWSCSVNSLHIDRPSEVVIILLVFVVILTQTKVGHGPCIQYEHPN